jgi:hypothetical protein
MRIRAVIGIAACCAGLAACSAAGPKGPNTTVTTPSVGRPAPPISVDAALAHAPFSPYALLGTSSNDGLAPGESGYALAGECMTAAGYLNAASDVPMGFRIDPGLGISQPWGPWGYLGIAEAGQSGFRPTPGSALSELGIDGNGLQGDPASLPAAEQTALGKCGTIVQNFTDAQGRGSLAGIQAIANVIGTDVQHDPAVRNATKAWSACMSTDGFSYTDPNSVWGAAIQDMYGTTHGGINISTPVSTAGNQAQLALATADANCTQSTDLAGIYFAVQTSYEQQLVDANQQALTASVRRYRAAYSREVKHLTALLRTAKAVPFRSRKAQQSGTRSGQHSPSSQPTASG